IRSGTVFVGAAFGAQHTVDAGGNVVESSVIAEAIARSSAHAAALGADSDASATVKMTDVVKVLLDSGAIVYGDAVTLYALNTNLNFQADSNASCSCGGGDTDSTATVSLNLLSTVVAIRAGANDAPEIHVSDFTVRTGEYASNLYTHAHRSGGFLDTGDANAPLTYDAKQATNWSADVYLLGEPNPLLIVDESGQIVAKTRNVIVHQDSIANPALNVLDFIALGHLIVIEPILYDETPKAIFRSNHVDGHASTIDQTGGRFFIQETWDSVTIVNASDSSMLLLSNGGNKSIDTLSSHVSNTGTSNPEAIINVSIDNGSENTPSTWQWDVLHIFPATDVLINSVRGPPGATTSFDLTIHGDISNVIGTTTIRDDRGSIVSFNSGSAYVPTHTTNRLYLDSDLGSIGSLAAPFRVNLIQWACTSYTPFCASSTPHAVVLQAEAGVDVFLDVATYRNSSQTLDQSTPIQPLIGPVSAGHDVWINVRDSAAGTDPLVVGDINVDLFVPDHLPTYVGGDGVQRASSPREVWQHFWPDTGSTAITVGGPLVLVAYDTTLSPINADYKFCGNAACTAAGLVAGHDIDVHHSSTATAITFRVISDVDANFADADRVGLFFTGDDNSGRIDLLTNGSIIDTEVEGDVSEVRNDLRVGQIR
ncbi:MAG TPA: hypothetical protein VIV58_16400, partial [Kofleriaceae bacterium]